MLVLAYLQFLHVIAVWAMGLYDLLRFDALAVYRYAYIGLI